jgi:hypothetical protein
MRAMSLEEESRRALSDVDPEPDEESGADAGPGASGPYPEGFFDWPLEQRNEYFADKARRYDEQKRGKRRARGS